MANTIPNRQVVCEALMAAAGTDRDITVLCSDSRGSGSMAPFADAFPEQFVETGIAEQNLVSIAAGLARCGKRPFAVSPACFLSTRSMEQAKVDVAYSATNVKLIGISGGISYGALGMTHHSANDIAALASIPGLRVYLPSDRHLTAALMRHLVADRKPAYVRVGRNAVEDVYNNEPDGFVMDKAVTVRPGNDVTVIACGEMVLPAVRAADKLAEKGIACRVVDMYCVKPLDEAAVLAALAETRGIVTVEEHSRFGGLGSMMSQLAAEYGGRAVNLALPDEPAVPGKSQEVFDHYGLNADGVVQAALKILEG